MKSIIFLIVGLLVLPLTGMTQENLQHEQPNYRLIAHRGGVVDSLAPENSLPALEKAIAANYWMIEVDLRLTKDSVLIIQHDPTFKRYFGVDKKVSDMNWAEISKLKSDAGTSVLDFESVLKVCRGRINLMIDNKIRGNDTLLFTKVIDLLKAYDLYKECLMIGTEESTPFFTGKIRLSCTRKQLEENMKKPGYNAAHYYLFSGKISKDDVQWANAHELLTIGVVNAWSLPKEEINRKAAAQATQLKEAGVSNFQIDAIFEAFFR